MSTLREDKGHTHAFSESPLGLSQTLQTRQSKHAETHTPARRSKTPPAMGARPADDNRPAIRRRGGVNSYWSQLDPWQGRATTLVRKTKQVKTARMGRWPRPLSQTITASTNRTSRGTSARCTTPGQSTQTPRCRRRCPGSARSRPSPCPTTPAGPPDPRRMRHECHHLLGAGPSVASAGPSTG